MPAKLGVKHHKSVLTNKQVRALRKEYIPYVMGYKKLSVKYNVSISTIRDCVQYYTYRNIY